MGLEVDMTCELTFKFKLHSVIPGALLREETNFVLAVTDLLSTVHNMDGHFGVVVKNLHTQLLTAPVRFLAAVDGAIRTPLKVSHADDNVGAHALHLWADVAV
jgi:hypothetical protein